MKIIIKLIIIIMWLEKDIKENFFIEDHPTTITMALEPTRILWQISIPFSSLIKVSCPATDNICLINSKGRTWP
nr:hypothetical protein SYMBAF_50325 [Serratia symbiotica]